MFYQKPVGKFVLSVCRTLSCAVNGAERVVEGSVITIKPGGNRCVGHLHQLIEAECS